MKINLGCIKLLANGNSWYKMLRQLFIDGYHEESGHAVQKQKNLHLMQFC